MPGILRAATVLALAMVLSFAPARPQGLASPGAGSVLVNGYPEYQVDGHPFFPYVAAFYYHRIPADLWEPALVRYKSLGFNTLDLYVIWNWHQPTEDELDLDGRTNPQRNLKRVFDLASRLGLKIIARPGPYIFNEWRNGGYPDWLLRRSGTEMTDAAIREGWFPIPSSVQYFDSEEAAGMWLKDAEHWTATARWFKAFWDVAGPYSAARGGPLLTVQIDDDLAIGYPNYNGPTFWQYVDRYQELFRTAGVDVPLFTNAAFMRVTAEASQPPTADPLWIMGQWYLRTGANRVEQGDVAGLQYAVEALKTQPAYAPMIIEFNTNQYAGPWDTHASIIAPPADMLLAARVLYQNGLRGMTIYPPHDTLYPAGWEFAPANYHYAWESALDAGLEESPAQARALARDGRLVQGMGRLLAGTHEHSDAGIAYTIAAFPQAALARADMVRFAQRLITLQQLAYQAGINTAYVDIENEPLDHLTRHKVLFVPAAEFQAPSAAGAEGGARLEMSESSQRKLIAYVEQGGTLMTMPEIPSGQHLGAIFPLRATGRVSAGSESRVRFVNGHEVRVNATPLRFDARGASGVEVLASAADGSAVAYASRLAEGRSIVLGFDFTSQVPHAPVPTLGTWKPSAQFTGEQHQAAGDLLLELIREAGVERTVMTDVEAGGPLDPYLYTTLQVSNLTGENAFGFVAATNWSDGARRSRLRIRLPWRTAALEVPDVHVPARDSMWLPIDIPLQRLFEADDLRLLGTQRLVYATAELTAARLSGEGMEFDFYAPAAAQLVLRLDAPPLGNSEAAGRVLDVVYDRESRLARIHVPAAPAPEFRTTVRVPFPSLQPVLRVQADSAALPGSRVSVRTIVAGRGQQPVTGRAQLVGVPGWSVSDSQPIQIAPGAQATLEHTLVVPEDAVVGSKWGIQVCLMAPTGERGVCSTPHVLQVVQPVEWTLAPHGMFPVRHDVSLPTWPPLVGSVAPAPVDFELRLKNPLATSASIDLRFEGESLRFETSAASIPLDGKQERIVSFTAWPRPQSGGAQTKTGVYPFIVHVTRDGRAVRIPVTLAAVRRGQAIAYRYDFDRDGFEDVVLENEYLRVVAMPEGGGRVFAIIDKATGRNATTTVGAFRDVFTKRPPTYTWRGTDLRRVPWRWPELVLHNRVAVPRVVTGSGPVASVLMSYNAPDVFPSGATISKTLSLGGADRFFSVVYEVSPSAGDPEQRFRAGISTGISGAPRQAFELVTPADDTIVSRPIEAATNYSLPQPDGIRWIGISQPASGDVLGIFVAGRATVSLRNERFSSIAQIESESMPTSAPVRLKIGVHFSAQGIPALEKSYEAFTAASGGSPPVRDR